MAKIALSGKHAVGQYAFALVDDADVQDLAQFNWIAAKSGTGYVYAVRTWRHEGAKHFEKMHRRVAAAKAGMEVDHINRNTVDNRRENLRVVTHQQNLLNRAVASEQRQCRQCNGAFTAKGLAGSVKALYCSQECKAGRARERAAQRKARQSA